ncbi:MAG: His/Gly/Thr/Pro-type tRNA ligase C-terminal domain-containing protein, partial [Candidatus Micrarchaeales archaeon]
LGIDRILEMLDLSSSIQYTYSRAFVINVKESNYMYALKVANKLRSKMIATDINISARNISNQFAYANSIKTKYAVIVGDAEEKLKKVKLRDLATGKEEIMEIDDAINTIKGEKIG